MERQCVIKGDTATLFRLWAPTFVVNNPDNRVVTGAQVRAFIRSGKLDYTDVWVRTSGAWHLTARQATNILVE